MTMVFARCRNCHGDQELEIVVVGDMYATSQHLDRIERLITQQGAKMATALENLQAANLAEEGELVTFLTDISGKLDGHDDPAIQAVADDINARVAKIQAADPGAPVETPPVDETPAA